MSNITVNQKTGEVVAKKAQFSDFMKQAKIQEVLQNTLQDTAKSKRFTTAIITTVANNPLLKECEHNTILTGALLGESLNLHPSLQLGQYYLVPFNNKNKGVKEAQFILGYKGLLQLAIRSGKYKSINVIEIKKEELKGYDPLTEELDIKIEQDPLVRENLPTIGYYASFKYLSGFEKQMYWSKEKVDAHARKYSKNYLMKNHQTGKLEINKNSIWATDFDAMAKKTLLRHLLTHWGELSTDMAIAIENDNNTIKQDSNGSLYSEEEDITVVENAEMQDFTETEEKANEQETEREEISLDEID